MRSLVPKVLALTISVCIPCTALAQGSGDEDAINRLIDHYSQLEDAADMTAQAALMTADRGSCLELSGSPMPETDSSDSTVVATWLSRVSIGT
jgi:hypothetical protein